MSEQSPGTGWRRLLRPRVRRAVDTVTPQALAQSEPEPVDEAELALYEDAGAFRRRFGFVWSAADRKRLLFFQANHRLSHGQIRRLHVARVLRPEATGLQIAARRWEAVLGWGHVAVLALVFGPLFFLGLLATRGRVSMQGWLLLALVATSVLALAGAYYAYYVVPWRLRQRVEHDHRVDAEPDVDP